MGKLIKTEINVVSALIVKNGKILVVKRSDKTKNFPGMISFPGGKQENGETLFESIQRELVEETGYQGEPIGEEIFMGKIETINEIVSFYLIKCKIAGGRHETFDEMVKSIMWLKPANFIENLEKHGFYQDQIIKTKEIFFSENII